MMNLIIRGECNQECWETCLHPECDRHRFNKNARGFGEAKEYDMLIRRAKKAVDSGEPFLGQGTDSEESPEN